MGTVMGHSVVGEGAFQLLFVAVGGLHHALALMASGVVAKQPCPIGWIRSVLRFATLITLGLLAGTLLPSAVAVPVLGSAAAMAVGLVLVLRGRGPAWLLHAAVGFFGLVYGFVHSAHFANGSHDGSGIWDAVSTVVATLGAFGVGGFAAWAAGGLSTARSGALLGAGVMVAAGLSWLASGP